MLSGGREPEYLRYDEHLTAIMRHFAETARPIARVGHGIEILARAGVVAGRTMTTVAKCRLDAEVCGATYVDQPVVVDGNIVTARTFHDRTPWMRDFMNLLKARRGS